MKLSKVPLCQTVACALVPCVAEHYKTRASARNDPNAYLITDILQGTAVFTYLGSVLTLTLAVWPYEAKTTVPRYLFGCAALGMAYMTAYMAKEVYNRAVIFRNEYYTGPVSPSCSEKSSKVSAEASKSSDVARSSFARGRKRR